MRDLEKCRTVYADIRALLLLQDENQPASLESLCFDFNLMSNVKLENFVVSQGYKGVADFLKASNYFSVIEEDSDEAQVQLIEEKHGKEKKKKVHITLFMTQKISVALHFIYRMRPHQSPVVLSPSIQLKSRKLLKEIRTW